jgi:hypothetical protein
MITDFVERGLAPAKPGEKALSPFSTVC